MSGVMAVEHAILQNELIMRLPYVLYVKYTQHLIFWACLLKLNFRYSIGFTFNFKALVVYMLFIHLLIAPWQESNQK
jgi:hypothetical protein